MARQSDYSDLIADSICEQISSGRSLVQICDDPDFPHRSTVFRWLEAHETFRDKYARERAASGDLCAEVVRIEARPEEIRGQGSERAQRTRWWPDPGRNHRGICEAKQWRQR